MFIFLLIRPLHRPTVLFPHSKVTYITFEIDLIIFYAVHSKSEFLYSCFLVHMYTEFKHSRNIHSHCNLIFDTNKAETSIF